MRRRTTRMLLLSLVAGGLLGVFGPVTPAGACHPEPDTPPTPPLLCFKQTCHGC